MILLHISSAFLYGTCMPVLYVVVFFAFVTLVSQLAELMVESWKKCSTQHSETMSISKTRTDLLPIRDCKQIYALQRCQLKGLEGMAAQRWQLNKIGELARSANACYQPL